MEKHHNLSYIENFFSMLLTKSKISDNIFIGELPPTTDKEWEDFVNVDVGQIRNYGGFSSGYANIYLYTRPKGYPPRKNISALSKMEEVLNKTIEESEHSNYVIQEQYRDSGYDSNRQFYFDMISVNIIIR